MTFPPIAIVGRACILPGALSPDALWKIVANGDSPIKEPPKGRFRIDPSRVLATTSTIDRTTTARGGYVEGFSLDDTDLAIPRADLLSLDPLFSWLCHAGRDALADAKITVGSQRAGAVIGNLSFPTEGMTLWGEAAALGDDVKRAGAPWSLPHDPRDRFMSGLPAHIMARALKLDAGAFCLDAACASSLYAIHLAAQQLATKTADVMLAGAVNRADSLFLHVGFTALQALSPSGVPRPFDRRADGLVPAEGCAIVALMRLEDAVAQKRRIHGVIRGSGLSNDGRGKNLLAPSSEGQQRAIRAAWKSAGLDPADLDYVECHATGTPTGDRTEIVSLAEVFTSQRRLPVGSLKSNLGHLITAAGAAGLVKVLSALEHEQLPPSIHAEEPLDLLDGRLPFFVQERLSPWHATDSRPRRAAVSAFGFGGNNAHIVIEEYRRDRPLVAFNTSATIETVALVAITEKLGGDTVDVALDGLKFPPNDLKQSLAQQLLVFEAAREAVRDLPEAALPRERTGVFVGMGCDVAVTTAGLRWRAGPLARRLAPTLSGDAARAFIDAVRDAVMPPLAAQGVLGCMPNIPANRLNVQLDLRGPGFTVSAEEASGLAALDVACALIRSGEIDTALVGAVDASRDPRHEAAVKSQRDTGAMADGAVVVVAMTEKRARELGLKIFATVSPLSGAGACPRLGSSVVRSSIGDIHAAEGLFALARVAQSHANRIDLDGRPRFGQSSTTIECDALGGAHREITVAAADAISRPLSLHTFSAMSREDLLRALDGERVDPGPWRAAVLQRERLPQLKQALANRDRVDDVGMWARFSPAVTRDQIAMMFGTAGAVSPWPSANLLRAFPSLGDSLASKVGAERLNAIEALSRHAAGCLGDLLAASAHMQLLAGLARDVLRIDAGKFLGVSLGESNAMFAAGAWRDLDAMLDDMERSGLFDKLLFGSFTAARAYWKSVGRDDLAKGDPWRAVTVRASIDDIRAAAPDLVWPLVIHAPDEVEIGGAPAAVDELVRRLGVDAVPMPHMPAVHCPLLGPAAAEYRAMHRRAVTSTNVTIYGHAGCAPYPLADDAVADGLLSQGMATVDFPALLRRVVSDGARVLIDASPRALCATWARRSVDVEVISLDTDPASAIARLFVSGVEIFFSGAGARPRPEVLSVPAHTPPGKIPPSPTTAEPMPPPPMLPARRSPVAQDSGLPEAIAIQRAALLDVQKGFFEAASQGHQQFLAAQQQALARLLAFEGVEVMLPPGASPGTGERVLWDRRQLEILASGRIADVWGETFAIQDDFRRQVRMPEPPLLLADRVISIDATAGVLEKNRSIVTETDIVESAWYLHENRCPAGVLIETGQADLLLVSYMGVDFENRGERVYRLLGCDLTYRSSLPLAGTTLRHDIHVDGYATHGDTRIFFFHSDTANAADGAPILSVRNGQAGFFTDDELANSGGVLWTPEDVDSRSFGSHTAPPSPTKKRALAKDDLVAFSRGDAFRCFGDGFEIAQTHVRTPRIAPDRLLLIDRVTDLDFHGGPWKRGFLRAELDLDESSWFFAGHFKNDPCMPGTIMFEGCLETLAIYLAAAGFTLKRDGFRFEPVVDKTFKLRCRGQAIPSSRKLVYDVFIRALVDGPEPVVVADILVTVDGLKSLHCEAVELKLACDWPISSRPQLLTHGSGPEAVAAPGPPAVFDQRALLATGIGKPSEAFPGLYEPFDGGRRVPRLPGPPYHFMSRVTHVEGPPPGSLAHGLNPAGTTAVVEYDVPADAWFFRESHNARMPFAVLLEIALQPCGWISSYVGSALTSDGDLFYRNLDGNNGIVHREIDRDIGTLITTATLTKSSSSGGMIIQELDFSVTTKDGAPVFNGSTVFGFFPPEALARQVGIASAPLGPNNVAIDLRGHAAMPGDMLRMIDRVTFLAPSTVRTEKDVKLDEWFFKAHFFQDPVQPGSLGLEAMLQAMQFLAVHEGHTQGMRRPRFESIAVGVPLNWKYRGQVIPKNKLIQVEIENAQVRSPGLLIADGSLWVDGLKIYSATGMGLRIVDDDP